jgi:glycine betaine/choline ABC-type transport system substrate-binding protein
LASVRREYGALGLSVGAPLGFNNTFALVMRRDDAARRGIATVSDLAPHVTTLRVGLFGEFLERQDGMPGLLRAYGFRFAIPPREMDLGLLYQSLSAGQVDLVVGSATDGLIAALDLVVLDDDRRYFPPYDAVPILGVQAEVRHPGIGAALEALDGRLDAAEMRRLNLAVDRDHRSPRDVAAQFGQKAGLFGKGPEGR